MATFYATDSQASAGGLPVGATQVTNPWIVAGNGTAGASASGVLSVQGITSGTPIPISGSITATNPSVSGTGLAVPADATMVGGSDGTNLRALACSTAGILSVSESNFPTTVDTNVGAVGASTPRSVDGARSLTTVLGSINTASTNITTSAYVQLIASTAAAVTRLYMWNTTGSIIKFATGASPTDFFYLGPGGTATADVAIAASTKISLEALDQTASAGWIFVTGLQ